MQPIIGAANVNFAGSWTTFWSSISGSLGGLTTLLAVVGMLLVVVAIITYIWERRRGATGGRGHSGVLWTIVAGMVLAAPNVVLPGVLTLVDFLANTISSAITKL